MTDALRYQQLTVVGAVVYNSYDASVNTPKRREENRIYLYAAVNLEGEVTNCVAFCRGFDDKKESSS